MSSRSEQLRLQRITSTIRLQERVVGTVANSLGDPVLCNEGHPGLRFSNPDWKHFCLLKSMRAVSDLNAGVCLFHGGFSQELPLVLRSVAECTTQIDFVVAGVQANGEVGPRQSELIGGYFADSTRDSSGSSKRIRIRQQEFHDAAGAYTEELVRQFGIESAPGTGSLARALSTVYLLYSNFVHSRYPEVMEMIDGDPLRIHLNGMRGTPKDEENLDLLEAFVASVSNALKFMLVYMNLVDRISQDKDLSFWLHDPAT